MRTQKDNRAGGRYAPALPWFSATNNNIVDPKDQQRHQAYQFYDDVFHNRPETFKATIRGDDDDQKPIYLPSAGTLVEAVARFLCVEFDFVVTAQDVQASITGAITEGEPSADTADIQRCQAAFERLFKREQMFKKFENNKRYGLVRGDSMWHVVADDTKPAGRRISIHELHPGQAFPIYDPVFGQDIVGYHLVSVVNHPKDAKKQACQRQTYRYVLDKDGNKTGGITTELTLWEIGKWDDRNPENKLEKIGTIVEEKPLPAQIDALPVYHIRNNEITGEDWGLSELSGFETLLNGMNQSITDEDMTLVMQGLGMYWTDAPPPTDVNGAEVDWQVGPGQVIEVGAGQQFGRLTGVSSVAPFQEHIQTLERAIQQRVGLSDVAVGDVDVSVVESGIALRMKLAPILAHNALKELEYMAIMDNFFFDLAIKWFPAYESLSFGNAVPECRFGDALPVDRKAVIDEIIALLGSTPPLITMEMALERMESIGFSYPSTAVEDLFALMQRISDTLAGGTGEFNEAAGDTEVIDGEVIPEEEVDA